MEHLKTIFDVDKVQSLDDWVLETIMPILEVIGSITEQLEGMYQELK